MEQHPVPQNVTTFQFRLVGDMTIKQFGYLAGGIIGGYLCYKLPLPFFFTWPLAIASGLLGFGLAFVPVEERPMDVWIASFFKNVYSPTQWVWQKETRAQKQPQPPTPPRQPSAQEPLSGGTSQRVGVPAVQQQPPATHHASMLTQIINIISSFVNSIVPIPKPKTESTKIAAVRPPYAPQKAPLPPVPAPPAPTTTGAMLSLHHTTNPLDWFGSLFKNKPKPAAPSLSPGFSFADALTARPTPSIVGKHVDSPIEAQAPVAPSHPSAPQSTVTAALSPVPSAAHPATHERVIELQGQLSEALSQRERMEKELITMRQRMDAQTQTPPMRQASVVPLSPTTTTSVRVIAPNAATKAGLPHLTTFPNVVTGIIKDQYGNLLSGMLVTVRDKDDTPLRALKTNKLGQFAASTPLTNNTYIIEIEDPKGGFVFDRAQILLTGAVAPLIEVTAKSQKQVERDKLAKEIFGQNQI